MIPVATRRWPALLALLVAAVTGACASATGARPQPFPQPAGARAERPRPPEPESEAPATGSNRPSLPPAPIPSSATTLLLTTALDLRGVQYRNGGSDPTGFDCSGFTQWVFARNGIALPREVKDQVRMGEPIERDELVPGDLVFFATTSSSASHVGIALDAETFVHAPSSRGVVRVERLTTDYWTRRFVGVRRIIGN